MKQLLTIILLTYMQVGFAQNDMLLLKTSGKVVIGDTTQISTPGNYNLYVQNGILTERVKVSLRNAAEWSDDAFDHTPSLQQVEESIANRKHLVDMPSAAQLVNDGYEVVPMDAKLLQQVEWLWQHMIAMQKENAKLTEKIKALESRLEEEKK